MMRPSVHPKRREEHRHRRVDFLDGICLPHWSCEERAKNNVTIVLVSVRKSIAAVRHNILQFSARVLATWGPRGREWECAADPVPPVWWLLSVVAALGITRHSAQQSATRPDACRDESAGSAAASIRDSGQRRAPVDQPRRHAAVNQRVIVRVSSGDPCETLRKYDVRGLTHPPGVISLGVLRKSLFRQRVASRIELTPAFSLSQRERERAAWSANEPRFRARTLRLSSHCSAFGERIDG